MLASKLRLARFTALHTRRHSHYATALAAPGVQPPPSLDPTTGVLDRDRSRREEFFTLPAAAFTSPAIFAEEQEAIFSRSWTYLDHVANLPAPGSYTTANVAGEELILVRGRATKGTEGEGGGGADPVVRAFHNVCSHRAHRIVEPGSSGRRPVLVCPNHAWSFKLNGKLLKARRASDESPTFDPDRYSLKEIRVENFQGLLFGNLDPDAQPLFESLKAIGLGEEMVENLSLSQCEWTCEATVEKEVAANWKALVDNFLECYHCDTAHKDFVDMVDMTLYQSVIHPRHVYNYSPCKPDNTAYVFSPDDPNHAIHYYWLWPNTVVYSAPGPYNLSVLQFIPLDEGRSLRRAHRFFAAPTDDNNGGNGGNGVATGGGGKRNGNGNGHDDEDVKETGGVETATSGTLGKAAGEAAARKEEEIQAARDAAVQYLNEVLLEEDTTLCESIQNGLNSRSYTQGRFVIDPNDGWATERAVAQFHGLCHEALSETEQL